MTLKKGNMAMKQLSQIIANRLKGHPAILEEVDTQIRSQIEEKGGAKPADTHE